MTVFDVFLLTIGFSVGIVVQMFGMVSIIRIVIGWIATAHHTDTQEPTDSTTPEETTPEDKPITSMTQAELAEALYNPAYAMLKKDIQNLLIKKGHFK